MWYWDPLLNIACVIARPSSTEPFDLSFLSSAASAAAIIISQEKLWVYWGGEKERKLFDGWSESSNFSCFILFLRFQNEMRLLENFVENINFPNNFQPFLISFATLKILNFFSNQNPWWDKSGIQWHRLQLSWKNCKFLKGSSFLLRSWHICIIGLACFKLTGGTAAAE